MGPFADGASAPPESEDTAFEDEPESAAGRSSGLRGWWGELHQAVRRGLLYSGLLLAVTLGAGWESGAVFGPRLGMNLWIAAVFALALYTHALAARRMLNEGICWGLAFAVLIGLGQVSDLLAS